MTFLIATIFQFGAVFGQQVIYPPDNRMQPYDLKSGIYKKAISATAVMVYQSHLNYSMKGDYFYLNDLNFESRFKVCSDHPFAAEPASGLCTGFLIDRDLILTAGHCLGSTMDCRNNFWLFDYHYKSNTKDSISFNYRQIYRCRKIVKRQYDKSKSHDYAIAQLERVVTDRDPLELNYSDDLKSGDPLFMTTHLGGLPLKIINVAHVMKSAHPEFFTANLDALGGSSGSPVINKISGLVEGILVRGNGMPSFYSPKKRACLVETMCSPKSCGGVEVTKIRQIF
ncbi:MAG: trypsin-like peptidase domain-containing protein [Bacteriovoracaceae bacterium]|nr:trypsin-like peptidase domain-containing protein [Bacteriovoracaceae bacterium]